MINSPSSVASPGLTPLHKVKNSHGPTFAGRYDSATLSTLSSEIGVNFEK